MTTRNRWQIKVYWLSIIFLFILNSSAYLIAYYTTHVKLPEEKRIGIPKPKNPATPKNFGLFYTTHQIKKSQSEWLEAWLIPSQLSFSKGTIILFPGHFGTKGSQLILPAQSFSQLGYDTFLIDFQGVGGSSGNRVTIGIKEAQDVVTAVKYAQELKPNSQIILYGVSMGSAAILRAISLNDIKPNAIILELPFLRLTDTIKTRFKHHHIPTLLTTELVIFWAGIQHNFNGFNHNPIDFAQDVNCPTLLIHGQQDSWTTVEEIKLLFNNFQGDKQLVISPNSGHQQLIGVNKNLWNDTIKKFFHSLDTNNL